MYQANAHIEKAAYNEAETLLNNFIRRCLSEVHEHDAALHNHLQNSDRMAVVDELHARIGYAHQMLGYSFIRQNNLAAAEKHYRDGVSYGEMSRSGFSLATCWSGIGAVYKQIGDLTTALECYSKALEIREQMQDKFALAAECGNLGIIHQMLGNSERAIVYLERTLRVYLEKEPGVDLVQSYSNLSLAFRNMGKLVEAEAALDRSYAIATQLNNPKLLAITEGNLGTMKYEVGKKQEGIDHMIRAMEIHQSDGRAGDAALWKSNIGWCYGQPSGPGYNPETAVTMIKEAIDTMTDLNMRANLPNAYESLSQVFENVGRMDEALQAHKNYHKIFIEIQGEKTKQAAEQQDSRYQLGLERARSQASEQVLHRVLPSSIAERLTRGEEVADHYENISVFFSDIVGFTPMASRMSPHDVISLLNFLFETFDRIMERHGCEKIKTIGDGYMAVAGAPEPCENHAERIVQASLALLAELELPESIKSALPSGSSLQLRIGLHCGPAIAGIVGVNRFVYDVYSDTVNTAARMESHGMPGRIHCSADFAEQLRSRQAPYILEDRGELEIKGKGTMRTYFLNT